jgi:AcrR family transcriptional regulator
MATIFFWLGYFHKTHTCFPEDVSPEEEAALVEREIASLERKLRAGLGLDGETVAALDFRGLEERLAGSLPEYSEDDRLLRAVAAAVAEAGPWNASMDMVARRSGLSKSGLYSHFENRREMLARLFLTEMERVLVYVEESREQSARAEERLYLAIIAGADYLRSRPEFLIAMDWLRLRNLNLGDHAPPRFRRMFQGIALGGGGGREDLADAADSGDRTERLAQWVFFLIVNVLLRWKSGERNGAPSAGDIAAVPNECFRLLYKFIALGMKGFDRYRDREKDKKG